MTLKNVLLETGLTCGAALFGVAAWAGEPLTLTVPEGQLTVRAIGTEAFQVEVTPPGATDTYASLTVTTPSDPATTQEVRGGEVWLSTGKATAAVDRRTGRVRFLDAAGRDVLSEIAGGRAFTRVTLAAGDESWTPQQAFDCPTDESLYGLGEHQDGRLDWRGETICLRQGNTEASVPVVWSTRGYALLWDNPAETWFNPGEEVPLKDGQGVFRAPSAGRYAFCVDRGRAGTTKGRIGLDVDGNPVADVRNLWVICSAGGSAELTAGEHTLRTHGGADLRVFARRGDQPSTVWRSKAGGKIRYCVFLGDTPRAAIANYRAVCGGVPLLPKYAWGFWQCRERYGSSRQLIEAVNGFRSRGIPLDIIVQDWMHWGKYGWNAMIWDEDHYPDVPALTSALHANNAKLMVSIWPCFEYNTQIHKDMKAIGGIVGNSKWSDLTSQAARDLYWDRSHHAFFDQGVDAYWQDAAEPEDNVIAGSKLSIGTGDRYLNAYPMFISRTVYEGQRQLTDKRRVSILTRCAYAGQQRYGSVVWSGDINSSWDSFRRQIVAGLGFSSSGMPFWTYDAGGFFRNDPNPSGGGRPGEQYTSDSYREKLVRWLQCATFLPVQRLHGYQSETEPWKYGVETEKRMTDAIRLRYRLLPYLYSWGWRIHNGDTLLRPLAMDNPADRALRAVKDEFMCGDALLVAPVVTAMFHPETDAERAALTTSRAVVLPSGGWYRFTDDSFVSGGQTLDEPCTLDSIPVYVRAGSILPLGPVVQHTAEKSAEPVELRVYTGGDARFELYDDAGDDYDYEKGNYEVIPLVWNEKTKTLTLGARQGKGYAAMPATRTFTVTFITPTGRTSRSVTYTGAVLTVAAE